MIGIRLYVEKDNHAAQQDYARLGLKESGYLVLERVPLPRRDTVTPGRQRACQRWRLLTIARVPSGRRAGAETKARTLMSPIRQVRSPLASAVAGVPKASLRAFLEDRNILVGELVGAVLVVGCSLALVISLLANIQRQPAVSTDHVHRGRRRRVRSRVSTP